MGLCLGPYGGPRGGSFFVAVDGNLLSVCFRLGLYEYLGAKGT